MPPPALIITVTLNPAIDQTLSIDNFTAGRVNRVGESHRQAAGKGVNVAAALADLGAQVVATGLLGRDNAGLFEGLFARKRISDQLIRVPGETRVGIKIIDPVSRETTDINFPGFGVTPAQLDQLQQRSDSLIQPNAWVVLAGSLPRDVSPDFYGELIDRVHSRSGYVTLDTSGQPLKHAIQHKPDLVKPNMDELAELVGVQSLTPAEAVEAARDIFISSGVRFVAVSMGADGALFVTADQAIRTRAPVVNVKSTVGAGDAMVAGLVYAFSLGQSLEDAARLATALGTHAVTRIENGLGTPNEYQTYIDQVKLETIRIA